MVVLQQFVVYDYVKLLCFVVQRDFYFGFMNQPLNSACCHGNRVLMSYPSQKIRL